MNEVGSVPRNGDLARPHFGSVALVAGQFILFSAPVLASFGSAKWDPVGRGSNNVAESLLTRELSAACAAFWQGPKKIPHTHDIICGTNGAKTGRLQGYQSRPAIVERGKITSGGVSPDTNPSHFSILTFSMHRDREASIEKE